MKVNVNWWKILSVAMAVSAWAGASLQDEKITADEIAELVKSICGILGVSPEITIPIGDQ